MEKHLAILLEPTPQRKIFCIHSPEDFFFLSSSTRSLETFLLHLNLMGPGWLRVKKWEKGARCSWCKYDIYTDTLKSIEKVEAGAKQHKDIVIPPEVFLGFIPFLF